MTIWDVLRRRGRRRDDAPDEAEAGTVLHGPEGADAAGSMWDPDGTDAAASAWDPDGAEDEAFTRDLDPAETAALLTLGRALTVSRFTLLLALGMRQPPDLLIEMRRDLRPLSTRIRSLTRRLAVRLATEHADPDTAALDAERQALEAAIADMKVRDGDAEAEADAEIEIPEFSADLVEEAGAAAADELVREWAWEETGRTVLTGVPDEDAEAAPGEERWVVFCGRESSAHLRVLLSSRLLARLEVALHADRLARLERRASRWYYERWGDPRAQGGTQEFSFRVREQEWSLLDRPMMALGERLIDAYVHQDFFRDVPPRQQELARRYRSTRVSAFRVLEPPGAGGTAVFRDERDGTRLTVTEHASAPPYQDGFLGLGRLIPNGDGTYMRSPGMAFVPDTDDEVDAPEIFRTAPEGMPAALVVELLLAGITDADVPRRIFPAESRAEARELLDQLHAAMAAVGLVEPVAAEELPDEMRGRSISDVVGYRMDEPMAEWLQALTTMVRGGAGRGKGGSRRKARAKRRRGGKKRR